MKVKCLMCHEDFSDDDLQEFAELGEKYHIESASFFCPDCWDSFQRLDLEDRMKILIPK